MITQDTRHVAEGIALLPEQYRHAPRMVAWLTAYLQQIQKLEDVIWAVHVGRLLQNNPTGDLLAKLGKIVGQASLGASDAVYALYIQARILTNRATGKREELIRIASLLVGSNPSTTVPIRAQDFYPAAVLVEARGAFNADPYVVARQFLGEAVAAGVRLAFVWTGVDPSSTIEPGSVHNGGFTAGPEPTSTGVTASQSLGSVHNGGFAAGPPVTGDGGGVLAGVVEV